MAGPQCHLIGGRKLRKELKAAGFDMRDLRTMHMRIARYVTDRAKPRAPKGPTGRLHKSVKPGATRTRAEIKAGASPRLPYANPVHWGWPSRMVHPYGNIMAPLVPAPIPPNRWVLEATQQTRPQWVGMYGAEMQVICDQVKGLPR